MVEIKGKSGRKKGIKNKPKETEQKYESDEEREDTEKIVRENPITA